ncbi:ABC transporter ATP-binding protein [Reyranella sp. CPCC 100927]|uniref:ABC transporter ATP-binding protein n=1 Tax=Reyranella sp. CPCC 100927 TaxID=2599616 RepID=UPI0011B85590|nr:ABC transporter ATP-binding protein [Reyranella sp. CPCC 100927]TWS96331.1 ABC transporter ATP-binding protein [Reyranella sp. CPCC 100927]
MSAITLREVSKVWGTVRALDDATFTTREGQLLVLLGPSGCGKSTTLRLIAGLDSASSGQIEILGRDVTNLPPAARNVSMVFQSYALFPHLSVAENIIFGLKVRHVPASERAARLKRAADMLGLAALLDRKPSQLSGGQQQRVALGRAIVAQTPVCLMDEPLSNLDAQLRAEMRREIRALQQRLGITMAYVTHDQVEAMTMADQVILMKDGRIEQDGAPAALYERPATIFTARFVGTPPMNVIPADAIAAAGSADPLQGAPAGSSLMLGVRPEHVRLVESGGVPASVTATEYLGADTLVQTRVGSSEMMARLPGRIDLAPGAAVRLDWQPGSRHWFDAVSGLRVE